MNIFSQLRQKETLFSAKFVKKTPTTLRFRNSERSQHHVSFSVVLISSKYLLFIQNVKSKQTISCFRCTCISWPFSQYDGSLFWLEVNTNSPRPGPNVFIMFLTGYGFSQHILGHAGYSFWSSFHMVGVENV
jgi:hypothetical protein